MMLDRANTFLAALKLQFAADLSVPLVDKETFFYFFSKRSFVKRGKKF